MDKYQNKYRIQSARAQWWDYGWNGAYFITICTHNREHFFGEIVETRLIASLLGQIADTIWHEIPNQFQYAELGDFLVMPNHIHGILILDQPNGGNKNEMNGSNGINGINVETRLIASLQTTEQMHNQIKTGGFAGNKNPMFNDNVSRIIRWYKGRCSFEIKKIQTDFAWQTRFHDHIIRNDSEYQRISNYIINNPVNWQDDKFYLP
ncbi:MAG: transposase [Candidatus Kapaibacterium sp.]|jgi:putative transposase